MDGGLESVGIVLDVVLCSVEQTAYLGDVTDTYETGQVLGTKGRKGTSEHGIDRRSSLFHPPCSCKGHEIVDGSHILAVSKLRCKGFCHLALDVTLEGFECSESFGSIFTAKLANEDIHSGIASDLSGSCDGSLCHITAFSDSGIDQSGN